MTGPLFFSLHPDRRRARLLLPFAAAILVGQLACSSDQSTGPTAPPSTLAGRHHPYLKLPAGMSSLRLGTSSRVSASVMSAVAGTGPKVLILADADAPSTDALKASIEDAGFQVDLHLPEYDWDGTNPSLDGVSAVIHLNGLTYDTPLSPAAQALLNSFVLSGGGFIGAQWNGNDWAIDAQNDMADLVLQSVFDEFSDNCADCPMTYNAVSAEESHPVLDGIPASFKFQADGHDAGPRREFGTNPSTVLMTSPSGGPAVLVRQAGSGKVVNFSFA